MGYNAKLMWHNSGSEQEQNIPSPPHHFQTGREKGKEKERRQERKQGGQRSMKEQEEKKEHEDLISQGQG